MRQKIGNSKSFVVLYVCQYILNNFIKPPLKVLSVDGLVLFYSIIIDFAFLLFYNMNKIT